MSFKKDGVFKFKVGKIDRIIDEKGSTFLALREIQWGVGQDEEDDSVPFRLDLRKYYNRPDGERMSSGVSFLTEEGPGELINTMIEEGYGDTTEILSRLMEREDFKSSVDEAVNGKAESDDDDFYDPREVLFVS